MAQHRNGNGDGSDNGDAPPPSPEELSMEPRETLIDVSDEAEEDTSAGSGGSPIPETGPKPKRRRVGRVAVAAVALLVLAVAGIFASGMLDLSDLRGAFQLPGTASEPASEPAPEPVREAAPEPKPESTPEPERAVAAAPEPVAPPPPAADVAADDPAPFVDAGDLDAAMMEARIAALEASLGGIQDAAVSAINDIGARTEELAGTIGAFEGRMASFETMPREPPDLSAFDARIAALEDMRSGGADAADLEAERARFEARAAALEDRIAALEERLAARDASAPAMLLAVGQLRAALRGSGPFLAELGGVRAVATGDAESESALDALAARAARGVPTLETLRGRFAGLASRAVRAAQVPAADGWIDKTVARLSELVTVRPVGDVPGTSTGAVVARIEARLEAGDLNAAIGEAGGLSGAPAGVVSDWLADARARLAADRALAQLNVRSIGALGTSSSGEGG